MDASNPRQFSCVSFSYFRFVSLLIFITLAGCLTPQSRIVPSAPPTDFGALAQDIAAFRALKWQREINLGSFNDETVDSGIYGPLQLQAVAQAYKQIGLLAESADLGGAMAEFLRLERLTTYDRIHASVAVAPNAAMLGAPFALTNKSLANEAPFGFAIIAALLQQNFQWQEKVASAFYEDRLLAIRAVTLGDAALTLIGRSGRRNLRNWSVDDLASAGRFASQLEKSAASLPEFLRQKLIFPFIAGSQFVLWALQANGWPGVDALYANPPITTAEILHPERYFLERKVPLRFFPAALLRSMKTAPATEQSLGEALTRVLLASANPSKFAQDTAAAWRGDHLFAFRERDSFTTAWFSAWRSAGDAVAFQRAYRNVLEKRRRVRFSERAGGSTTVLTATGSGITLWLQANGPTVLLLSGVSANRLDDFAEEAWKELEIDSAPAAIRFESAKRRPRGDSYSLSGK